MESQFNIELPFESQFDWRNTLFSTIVDHFFDAAAEILATIPENSEEFDWKDEDEILGYAIENGLFEKIAKRAKEMGNETIEGNLL